MQSSLFFLYLDIAQIEEKKYAMYFIFIFTEFFIYLNVAYCWKKYDMLSSLFFLYLDIAKIEIKYAIYFSFIFTKFFIYLNVAYCWKK